MKKGLTDLQKSVRPFVMDKLYTAPVSQPLPADKISKGGFERCYQSAIKQGRNSSYSATFPAVEPGKTVSG